MTGTLLNALFEDFISSFQLPCEINAIITSTLQTSKIRHGQIKKTYQGNIVSGLQTHWGSWISNPET